MNRNWRIVGFMSLGIAVCLVIGTVTVIHVVSLRLRHKAEVLESEVLALRPGSTTFLEVQDLVERTERPDGYAGYSGPCDENECIASLGFSSYRANNTDRKWLGAIGMRSVSYTAAIQVVEGRVKRVQFHVFYGEAESKLLSVTTTVLDEFSSNDLRFTPTMSRHPEYALCFEEEKADTERAAIEGLQSGISMRAAKDLQYNAKAFSLECVTSIKGCSSVAEFLPLAHRDWQEDVRHLGERGASCIDDSNYRRPWWGMDSPTPAH